MANYQNIKSKINEKIVENSRQLITGEIMNGVLNDLVDSFSGYLFGGVINTDTHYTIGDSNVFFIAHETGTYPYFGNLQVSDGEIAIFSYNGTWVKTHLNVASEASVETLQQGIAIAFPMLQEGLQNEVTRATNAENAIAQTLTQHGTQLSEQGGKLTDLEREVGDVKRGINTDNHNEVSSPSTDFVDVTLDEKYRPIYGVKKDGTFYAEQAEISGAKTENLNAVDFVDVTVDAKNKVLYGVKKDGTFYAPKIESPSLESNGVNTIVVAASDALSSDKNAANYVCDGINDEATIQEAINEIYNRKGGTIRLTGGTFYIDSFSYDNDGMCAIIIPSYPSSLTQGYAISIIGEANFGGFNGYGTHFIVRDSVYESLDVNVQYKIINCTKTPNLLNGNAMIYFRMENITMSIPWNQRKIMFVDLISCNQVYMHNVNLLAYTSGYSGGWEVSVHNPPAKAVEGCVGLRMTSGSNWGIINTYKNVYATGFHKGFMVGGEHVVCETCAGIFCVYAWTFGDYKYTYAFNHPITLIRCCDERGCNLPLFKKCGNGYNSAGTGGQMVNMIAFSVERSAGRCPGGVLGDRAKSEGNYHGYITYTIQNYDIGDGGNSVKDAFWEDGHGIRFKSDNSAQLQICSAIDRLTYAANYMQRVWDTTLNKEVICIDPATKQWVDSLGNTI